MINVHSHFVCSGGFVSNKIALRDRDTQKLNPGLSPTKAFLGIMMLRYILGNAYVIYALHFGQRLLKSVTSS